MGLMVWSEIPVYWTILWENQDTYDLAEQQLREMIQRDKNRASVVIWSVGNETPRGAARLAFMTGLIDEARRMDSSRLISAATEVTYRGDTLSLDDPLGDELDVIGANEYLGWYNGGPEEITEHSWTSEFDKPLVISEFGAGARYDLHGDEQTRWSEEYQAAVYRNQLRMLDGIPFLAGTTPWILVDFRSPRRPLPDIQDFFNRKGLISDRGFRKQAFFVLQEYYRNRE
jgi:beta-glucuronidase